MPIPRYARELINHVVGAAAMDPIQFGERYEQALEYLIAENDPFYSTAFADELRQTIYNLFWQRADSAAYRARIAYYNSRFFVDDISDFMEHFRPMRTTGLNVIGALYNVDAALHDPNNNAHAANYAFYAGNATYGAGAVRIDNTTPVFSVQNINGLDTLVIGSL